jgi:hypothetical protein
MIFCAPIIEITFTISKETDDIGLMKIVDVQSLLKHFKFTYGLKFGAETEDSTSYLLYIVGCLGNRHRGVIDGYGRVMHKDYLFRLKNIRTFIAKAYPYIKSSITCRHHAIITSDEYINIKNILTNKHDESSICKADTVNSASSIAIVPLETPMYFNDANTNIKIKGEFTISLLTVLMTPPIMKKRAIIRTILKRDKYLYKKETEYYKILTRQCANQYIIWDGGEKHYTRVIKSILKHYAV